MNMNKFNETSFLEATLEFQQLAIPSRNESERIRINSENSIHPANGRELLTLESNIFRSEVIDRTITKQSTNPPPNNTIISNSRVKSLINKFSNLNHKEKNNQIKLKPIKSVRIIGREDSYSEDLANRMKSWCSTVESRYSDISQEEVQKLKNYVKGLYLDLTGEINLACSDSANFEKWGKHFLPSIRRAHQLQQCNNFKDPGVQFYGGSLFNSLRDQAEDMFCTLPAPVSSHVNSYEQNSYGSSSSTPYDMSAYMNASAGCISGNCDILLSNGNVKLMKDVMKGDKVCCNLSYNNPNQRKYEAIVECVVRTRCENKVEMVQFPSGLIATPWHPVYLTNQNQNNHNNNQQEQQEQQQEKQDEWIFPFEYIGESQLLSEEYVYNLVLGSMTLINDENDENNDQNNDENNNKRGQSFIVNGMECISLAHGIKNDKVAEHEFYGSEKVVESLQSLVGIDSYFKTGLVTMNNSQIVRDPITGLVCNYK